MKIFNKIENLDDWDLIEWFKSAVCDNNYNPGSTPYNTSGFTLSELEAEIKRRMQKED